MATVPRAPLISPPPKRTWINGVHDQGSRGSPATLIVINPPIRQRDWPVPDPRPRSIQLLTWLNDNPNIFKNPFPVGQRADFSAPLERPYGLHLRTWFNQNPNLYTNSKPGFVPEWPTPPARSYANDLRTWVYGSTAYIPAPVVKPSFNPEFPVPPSRPADIELRTWTNSNPNLYTNPEPVQNPEFPVPPSRPYDLNLRTWISQNPNLYTNDFPVGEQSEALPPPERSYGLILRAWTNNNPNLYTNPVPVFNPEFPAPAALIYGANLRTWAYSSTAYIPAIQTPQPQFNPEFPVPAGLPRQIGLNTWVSFNPSLYTNPIPFNQVNWPTPAGLFHGEAQKTWVVPTNPNLFTPPTTLPFSDNGKQFIGEIQSLGIGSIFDSSMGVT